MKARIKNKINKHKAQEAKQARMFSFCGLLADQKNLISLELVVLASPSVFA
jgi:hypothetical protein